MTIPERFSPLYSSPRNGALQVYFLKFLLNYLEKSRSVAFRYKRHSGLAHIFVTKIPERPIQKKLLYHLESLDVAFRYWRYSGLTHQNVKIKAMCTVHISQIFPFEYWWIFSIPLNTYVCSWEIRRLVRQVNYKRNQDYNKLSPCYNLYSYKKNTDKINLNLLVPRLG